MPPKKKLAAIIKLQIKAGQATPAPPVGPALGQHGVNIMEFCKQYNAATESQRGQIVPVEISVYEDRSFDFITKTPPAARLLLAAAGVEKGSGEPHKTKVAKVTMAQVREIAELKMEDLNANDIDQAAKIIAGTARSMGITVDGLEPPLLARSRRMRMSSAPKVATRTRGRTADSRRPLTTNSCERGVAMKHSKGYNKAAELIEEGKIYSPLEAAKIAKETSPTKFDATVEVALRLGVDPRKADQMVRGTVSLPHGTGKTARVIVFATGDKAAEAEAAGADRVGSDDLIAEIQGGFLDFDAAIATPDQMAKVGRIARVLGPRGLMPNPKTGTVTPGRRQGRQRHQGRQDQLPGRQAVEPAPGDRQGVVHRAAAGRELRRRARRGRAGQAVVVQGQVRQEGHLLDDDGPGHPGRPEPHPQPARGRHRLGRSRAGFGAVFCQQCAAAYPGDRSTEDRWSLRAHTQLNVSAQSAERPAQDGRYGWLAHRRDAHPAPCALRRGVSRFAGVDARPALRTREEAHAERRKSCRGR